MLHTWGDKFHIRHFLCQISRFLKKRYNKCVCGVWDIRSCLFFWYKVSWVFSVQVNQLWPELLILGIQVHSICMYGRNCNTTGLNCMSHFGLQFFFKMCKILFDYTRELMIGYKKKEVDKKNKNIWKFKSCQIIQHI